jgi:CheY-like chemotaxis protein
MILATTYSHSQELESIIGTIDGLLSKPVSSRHLYVEIANCAGIEDVNAPSEKDRRKKNGKDWSSLQQLNILVAEDIEVNQEVIKELLASVGLHKVRIVSNGIDAIADVERHAPDLILMDCQMPLLDGYEATKRIRLLPGAHHLPIIALTANATLVDQEKCFEAGMNGHVAKPIRMEVLFEQMSRCLPDSRLKQQLPTHSECVNKVTNPPNFPGINFDIAITNVGGSLPFLLKVLKKFRDNQGTNFENELNEAIRTEDWKSLYRHAHSLKGVSKTLGAMALSELAVALQDAAEKHDVAALNSLLSTVHQQMDEIVRGLSDLEQLIEDAK